jgi:pseudaminic acid biosynthesis-associated methylase
MPQPDEAARLERLWSGEFGDRYTERNRSAGERRGPFWSGLLEDLRPRTVLEVGCNVGANLRWIAGDRRLVLGLDVNEGALRQMRAEVRAARAVAGSARSLPFADRSFDLVFTAGVLIHQPREALPAVMREIVRSSGRFVLAAEYYAPEEVEVEYRGQRGALFKRDYGRLYLEAFPDLALHARGHLGTDEGWDDVTYWVFRRR